MSRVKNSNRGNAIGVRENERLEITFLSELSRVNILSRITVKLLQFSFFT